MEKREEQMLIITQKFAEAWFNMHIKMRRLTNYDAREKATADRTKLENEFIDDVLKWYNGVNMVLDKLARHDD